MMQELNKSREWLNVIREQEKTIRFERFGNDEALEACNIAVRIAREKYHGSFMLTVTLDGVDVLSYMMPGTNAFHTWWIGRKLRCSARTGVSSLLTFLEAEYGERPHESWQDDFSYALNGGCFPIRSVSGELLGWLTASGMAHEQDHQLAADALAELAGASIGSIV